MDSDPTFRVFAQKHERHFSKNWRGLIIDTHEGETRRTLKGLARDHPDHGVVSTYVSDLFEYATQAGNLEGSPNSTIIIKLQKLEGLVEA
jgi:hypothetical protein